MELLISTLEQGLIYGILGLGVYITYKILDFPDLTADGSFPLGAAVTAAIIANGGSPILAMVASIALGALAGLITGIIHVKCRVRDLLSGIITMTALYSINLRIAGMSNVPLFGKVTLFKNPLVEGTLTGALEPFSAVIVVLIVVIVFKVLMDLFLKTKAGYLLRAVGDNDTVVTSLAKDKGSVKIMGLVIANALVALSGCILCQQQRFFEIQMGTGAIVIGLAAVIIGTNLFKKMTFVKATTSVIIGSIIYKGCVAAAIQMGLDAGDMRLITAVLFLAILVAGNLFDRKGDAA
ncbi:MAG: ABC transporter permease [Clostridiales bacterium]|nr:ABC transporter permease [Clostridiales bacterium]